MKETLVLLIAFFAFSAFSEEFMQEAKNRTRVIMKQILKHPFLLELANGTLPIKKFQEYAVQDNIYSWRYADPLTLLAMKTSNFTEKLFFLKEAYDSTQEWNGTHPENVKQCPSCQAYSDFELAAAQQSFLKGLASVAPCYVVYAMVAQWLKQNTVPNNPYQSWINIYAKPGFQADTLRLEAFLNKAAQEATANECEQMLNAYVKSTRYEWQFWNSIYHSTPWEPTDEQP